MNPFIQNNSRLFFKTFFTRKKLWQSGRWRFTATYLVIPHTQQPQQRQAGVKGNLVVKAGFPKRLTVKNKNRVGLIKNYTNNMKKLIIAVAAVCSLALFSFIKQPAQVKFTRVTAKLYQTKTVIPMSAADKNKFESLIKEVYNIKEFNGEVVLKYLGDKKTGFSVASTKLGAGAFTQTIYDVSEPEEVAAACIYQACPPPPPPPTKGDIMNILNRY